MSGSEYEFHWVANPHWYVYVNRVLLFCYILSIMIILVTTLVHKLIYPSNPRIVNLIYLGWRFGLHLLGLSIVVTTFMVIYYLAGMIK